MTVSAEGRVENQKLTQTAALLSFGWVFGFQLDLLEKNFITLTRVSYLYALFSEGELRFGLEVSTSRHCGPDQPKKKAPPGTKHR